LLIAARINLRHRSIWPLPLPLLATSIGFSKTKTETKKTKGIQKTTIASARMTQVRVTLSGRTTCVESAPQQLSPEWYNLLRRTIKTLSSLIIKIS